MLLQPSGSFPGSPPVVEVKEKHYAVAYIFIRYTVLHILDPKGKLTHFICRKYCLNSGSEAICLHCRLNGAAS